MKAYAGRVRLRAQLAVPQQPEPAPTVRHERPEVLAHKCCPRCSTDFYDLDATLCDRRGCRESISVRGGAKEQTRLWSRHHGRVYPWNILARRLTGSHRELTASSPISPARNPKKSGRIGNL